MALPFDEVLLELRRALAFGIHPSLQGITELCEDLGRPQDAFSCVQITGTNGKTSTARFTAALLQAEGLSTGLYTSPELERYPERMEMAGRVASDAEFAVAVSAALLAAERLRPGARGSEAGFTEFELLTAAALWLFREHGVEAAVLEVGLGGRWDATSVVSPRVAVITGVGLDHTAILGDSLVAIAAEKAAIIRPGSTAVLGPGTSGCESVFLDAAARAGVPVVRPRSEVSAHPTSPDDVTVLDVVTPKGRYSGLRLKAPTCQAANAATALSAAESFLGRPIDPVRASAALASTALPGRFEVVRHTPTVIIDGSHNPQAAAALAEAIADAWPDPQRRPQLLLGVLADKDALGIVTALVPVVGSIAVTRPISERALPAEALASVVERVSGLAPPVLGDIASALHVLLPTSPNGLVISGSLTTAGQARRILRDMSATDAA